MKNSDKRVTGETIEYKNKDAILTFEVDGSLTVELLHPGIEIYETEDGTSIVEVTHSDNTLYLSLNQMSMLFGRDKSVVSRHLSNIFKEGELERKSVVAFFATTAEDSKTYQVEYFNLDAILSVGYRVNSKQGTQFRKWATNILQQYMITGYAINQYNLTDKKIQELQQTVDLLSKTLVNQALVNDLGIQVIEVIQNYAKTWRILLEYDEGCLELKVDKNSQDLVEINYEEAKAAIDLLKAELIRKGEGSGLFGLERGDALIGLLGNLLQTFDSIPLYPSNIDRAAHLLYFIIKDHPFSDGNKRIGSLLFLLFLAKSGISLDKLPSNSMIALALLIAESDPMQKEIMIKLIMKMLE